MVVVERKTCLDRDLKVVVLTHDFPKQFGYMDYVKSMVSDVACTEKDFIVMEVCK